MSRRLTVEQILRAGRDRRKTRLARGCPRNIWLWPKEPPPDALVFGERGVGSVNCSSRRGLVRFLQQENGAGLGVAVLRKRNDHTIAHATLQAQRVFQVIGINIQARRRDDDNFLASAETQIAFRVHFSQVAGMQPAFFARRLENAIFPIARRDVFSAAKKFSATIRNG